MDAKTFLGMLDHTHQFIHLDPASDELVSRQPALLLSPSPAEALGASKASSLSLSPATSASNMSFQTAMSHTPSRTMPTAYFSSSTSGAVAESSPLAVAGSHTPQTFASPTSMLSGSISSPEHSMHVPGSAGSSSVESPEPVPHSMPAESVSSPAAHAQRASPGVQAGHANEHDIEAGDADLSAVPRQMSSGSWASGISEMMAAASAGSSPPTASHSEQQPCARQGHTGDQVQGKRVVLHTKAGHKEGGSHQGGEPAHALATKSSMFAPALLRSALRFAGAQPIVPPTRYSTPQTGSTASHQLSAAVAQSVQPPSVQAACAAKQHSFARSSSTSRITAAANRLPTAALDTQGRVVYASGSTVHRAVTQEVRKRRTARKRQAGAPLSSVQARLADALDLDVCNCLLKMLFARFSCYGDRASTPLSDHVQALLGVVSGGEVPASQAAVPDIDVRDVRMRSNQFARLAVACGVCNHTSDWPLTVSRSDVDVVFASAMSSMVKPQGGGAPGEGTARVYMWKENAFDVKSVSKSMLRLRIDYGHFTQALLLLASKKYCQPQGADRFMMAEASDSSSSYTGLGTSFSSTGLLNASLADTLVASEALSDGGSPRRAQRGHDKPLRPKDVDPPLALKLLLLRHLIPLAVRFGFVGATTSVLDRALSPAKARLIMATGPQSPAPPRSQHKDTRGKQNPNAGIPSVSSVPVANVELSDSDVPAGPRAPQSGRSAADFFPLRTPQQATSQGRKWAVRPLSSANAEPALISLGASVALGLPSPEAAPTPEAEQIAAYLERTTYATQHLQAITHMAVSAASAAGPAGFVPGVSVPPPGNRHARPPSSAPREALPPLAEMMKLIPTGAPKGHPVPKPEAAAAPVRKPVVRPPSAADRGGHGLHPPAQPGSSSRSASITEAASQSLSRVQALSSTVPSHTTAPTASLASTGPAHGAAVYRGVPLKTPGAAVSGQSQGLNTRTTPFAPSDDSDSDEWGISAAFKAGLTPAGVRQWAPAGPWGSTKAADRDLRYGEAATFLQPTESHQAGFVPAPSAASVDGDSNGDAQEDVHVGRPPSLAHRLTTSGMAWSGHHSPSRGTWSQSELDVLPKRDFGNSPTSHSPSATGSQSLHSPNTAASGSNRMSKLAMSPFMAGFHSASSWKDGTSPISCGSQDSLQRSMPLSPGSHAEERATPFSQGRVRFTESAVDRDAAHTSPPPIPVTPGQRAVPKTPATDKAQKDWMAQYALSAETKKRLAGYDVDSGDPIGTAYTGAPSGTTGVPAGSDASAAARSTLRRSSAVAADEAPVWAMHGSPTAGISSPHDLKALGRQLDYSIASHASRQSTASFGVHDMQHSPPLRAPMAPTPSPAALLAHAQNAMQFAEIDHSADFTGVGLLDSTISRAAERTASRDSSASGGTAAASHAVRQHNEVQSTPHVINPSMTEAAVAQHHARVTISPDGAITILTPHSTAPQQTTENQSLTSASTRHTNSEQLSTVHSGRSPSMHSSGSASYRIHVDATGVSIQHFAQDPCVETTTTQRAANSNLEPPKWHSPAGSTTHHVEATQPFASRAHREPHTAQVKLSPRPAEAEAPSPTLVSSSSGRGHGGLGTSPTYDRQRHSITGSEDVYSSHGATTAEHFRLPSEATNEEQQPWTGLAPWTRPANNSHADSFTQRSAVGYALNRVRHNIRAAHTLRSSSVLLSSQRLETLQTADSSGKQQWEAASEAPVQAVADMSADEATGGPHHASPLPKRAALATYTAAAARPARAGLAAAPVQTELKTKPPEYSHAVTQRSNTSRRTARKTPSCSGLTGAPAGLEGPSHHSSRQGEAPPSLQ